MVNGLTQRAVILFPDKKMYLNLLKFIVRL